MKILLINYRHFVSGGPERYMFNLKDLLRQFEHEVISFSVLYKQNIETTWARYFVPPIANEDEVTFKEHSWNFTSFRRALARSFYSKEVYRSLQRLIADTQPDIALVLHYLRKLSPSVLVALKEFGVPLVVRLSDFAMLCPGGRFLRAGDICELCLNGKLWPSIRFRCVQGSLGASLVNALATIYHRKKKFFDLIDAFIVPSEFSKKKMIQGGWPKKKIHHLPTFVNLDTFRPKCKKEPMVTYIGRIRLHKGVGILLKAFQLIKQSGQYDQLKLVIAGDDKNDEAREFKMWIQNECISDIVFTGILDQKKISDILSRSLFSVIPSLWYDNLPNAGLESLACGTPIVASNLGSLPEIVEDRVTGLLFEPGNTNDLKEKMLYLLNNPQKIKNTSQNARVKAEQLYNPELHYQNLLNILKLAIKKS